MCKSYCARRLKTSLQKNYGSMMFQMYGRRQRLQRTLDGAKDSYVSTRWNYSSQWSWRSKNTNWEMVDLVRQVAIVVVRKWTSSPSINTRNTVIDTVLGYGDDVYKILVLHRDGVQECTKMIRFDFYRNHRCREVTRRLDMSKSRLEW